MSQITFITNDNKVVEAPSNSNLLRVSLREKGGIPFKCGGGLCGTCRCKIESGIENTDTIKPKEKRHLTDEDIAQGFRMACQTFVDGDISVSWDKDYKPRPLSAAVRPQVRPVTAAPASAEAGSPEMPGDETPNAALAPATQDAS
jgi:ferredoxin